MNVSLTHFDLGPLFYGVVMFLGIAIMWWKLSTGRWLGLVVDVCAFALVFKLHGGTMAGGFAAMIAALLAGMIFPMMIRR
jgi:hypothetical protein